MATIMYSITINVEQDQLNGLTSDQLLNEVANFLEEILEVSAVVVMDELPIQEGEAEWDEGTIEMDGWWDGDSGETID